MTTPRPKLRFLLQVEFSLMVSFVLLFTLGPILSRYYALYKSSQFREPKAPQALTISDTHTPVPTPTNPTANTPESLPPRPTPIFMHPPEDAPLPGSDVGPLPEKSPTLAKPSWWIRSSKVADANLA